MCPSLHGGFLSVTPMKRFLRNPFASLAAGSPRGGDGGEGDGDGDGREDSDDESPGGEFSALAAGPDEHPPSHDGSSQRTQHPPLGPMLALPQQGESATGAPSRRRSLGSAAERAMPREEAEAQLRFETEVRAVQRRRDART